MMKVERVYRLLANKCGQFGEHYRFWRLERVKWFDAEKERWSCKQKYPFSHNAEVMDDIQRYWNEKLKGI